MIQEKEGDRLGERNLATFFSERYGLEAVRAAQFSSFDYLFLKAGKMYALAEIKRRTIPKNHYPEYMLGKGKFDRLVKTSELMSIPCVLIVQWSDEIGVLGLSRQTKHRVDLGGRLDRPDSKEVCCYFSVDQFQTVKGNL